MRIIFIGLIFLAIPLLGEKRSIAQGLEFSNSTPGLSPGNSEPRKQAIQKIQNFSMEFSRQYLSFCAANGILATLSTATKSNPVEIHQAVDSCFDILGATGFLAFMAGSHGTQKILMHSTQLSPFLKSAAGMGVGLLMSSIAHEFLEDFFHGDLMVCRKGQNVIDKHRACEKALHRWWGWDKYRSYTPNMFSLFGAFGMSTLTGYGTVRILGQEAAAKVKSKIFTAGMTEVKIAGRLVRLMPGSWALSIGNFVLFLGWDRVIAPHVNKVWGGLNLSILGFAESEQLRDSKGEHSILLRSYRQQHQDWEWLMKASATGLPNTYNPDDLEACARYKVVLDKSWFRPHRPSDWGKKYERCLRRLKPLNIIQNEYAFNKERTRVITMNFSAKRQNWYEFLGNYIEIYDLTRIFTKLLIQNRQSFDAGEISTEDIAEALSKESLRSLFNQLSGFPAGTQKVVKRLNDIKFNHMADYIVYSLVCGPSVPKNKSPEERELIKGISANSISNSPEIEFIKLPFGSSMEFIPPKIALSDKSICRHDGPLRSDLVFNGQWAEKGMPKFKNLALYLFHKLDPEIIDFQVLTPESSFDWWESQIHIHTQKVWSVYDRAYRDMVKKDLLPNLIGLQGRKFYQNGGRILPDLLNNKNGLIDHYQNHFLKNMKLLREVISNFSPLPEEHNGEFEKLQDLVLSISDDLKESLKKWDNQSPLVTDSIKLEKQVDQIREISESTISYIQSTVSRKEITSRYLEFVIDPLCREKNLQTLLYLFPEFDPTNSTVLPVRYTSDLSPFDRITIDGIQLPMGCNDREEARSLLQERVNPQLSFQLVVQMVNEYLEHIQELVLLTKPLGY